MKISLILFYFFAITISLFSFVGRLNFNNWSNFNENWQKEIVSVGARIHFISGNFSLFFIKIIIPKYNIFNL